MKIFNRFWCWVVLRQLRQKFHHFCTIFKDSCTLYNFSYFWDWEIWSREANNCTLITPDGFFKRIWKIHVMKDYNWLMKEMRMLTVVWRAAVDQRSSSIKKRQKIVLRGCPAPPRLGPRPWGGGRGKLARPVQEWEQVVGIHVVQLQNCTLFKLLRLLAPINTVFYLIREHVSVYIM